MVNEKLGSESCTATDFAVEPGVFVFALQRGDIIARDPSGNTSRQQFGLPPVTLVPPGKRERHTKISHIDSKSSFAKNIFTLLDDLESIAARERQLVVGAAGVVIQRHDDGFVRRCVCRLGQRCRRLLRQYVILACHSCESAGRGGVRIMRCKDTYEIYNMDQARGTA